MVELKNISDAIAMVGAIRKKYEYNIKTENIRRRNAAKDKDLKTCAAVIAMDVSFSSAAMTLYNPGTERKSGAYIRGVVFSEFTNKPYGVFLHAMESALQLYAQKLQEETTENNPIALVIETLPPSIAKCDRTGGYGALIHDAVYYISQYARDVLGLVVVPAYTWAWRKPFGLPTRVMAKDKTNQTQAETLGHDILKQYSVSKFSELMTRAKERKKEARFFELLQNMVDEKQNGKKTDDIIECVLMTEAFLMVGADALIGTNFNNLNIEDVPEKIRTLVKMV